MMGGPGYSTEEDHLEPAAVRSDLLNGRSQITDDIDEIPNGSQKEPAAAPAPMDGVVKRKRGRPRKDATKAESSGKGSKRTRTTSTANGQRRSSRIVEQVKLKPERAFAQDAGRVRKRVSFLLTVPQPSVPR